MSLINRFPLTSRFLIWIVLPITAAFIAVVYELNASLPDLQGEVSLSGLQYPVEITHDKYGAPHINARTDLDAYFALGMKHASDRLWQLEMQRRFSQGRLSEILGPEAIQSDIWVRTLGFSQAARKSVTHLSPATLQILQAYSNGINAWVNQQKSLPIEFKIFNVTPEKWTIEDSLAWQKVLSLNLSGNMFDEIRRHALLTIFDAHQLSFFYPYDELQELTNYQSVSFAKPVANRETLMPFGIGHKYTGSNAWVVSGKFTASGSPMLANDPHLGLQLPALWYKASLSGDTLNVSGMTLVGIPAVIFGQNASIAWGGTNLMSDQQDLYIETTSPEHPNQYLSENGWKNFLIREESINISPGFPAAFRSPLKPVNIKVRETERGPIVSDVTSSDEPLSLRWAALDETDQSIEAFIQLNHAKDWDGFRKALSLLKSPGLNFVFADRSGNIGYQAAGMMPKRRKGTGILPQLASSESNWDGYVDFTSLPSSWNPAGGILVSANEQISGNQALKLSHEWAPKTRHDRIEQLLHDAVAQGHPLTVEAMAKIQNDSFDTTGLNLKSLLVNVTPDGKQTGEALTALKQWDGVIDENAIGPTIISTWSFYLIKEILEDDLTSSWQRAGLQNTLLSSDTLVNWQQLAIILSDPSHGWCKSGDELPCTSELRNSLHKTVEQLEKITGTSDVQKWTWENVAVTELRHQPLGALKGFKRVFSRKSHQVTSPDSINASNTRFDSYEGFIQDFGAGFRQVFDLHNFDNHWYMISAGESGNVMSPHFDDMFTPFARGELTQSAAEQQKRMLTIFPAEGVTQ